MKASIELHFQHEALPHFIENVLRSTLSYPNETSNECIQFLNKKQIRSHKQIRSYKKQTNTNYANKICDKAGDYSGMRQHSLMFT